MSTLQVKSLRCLHTSCWSHRRSRHMWLGIRYCYEIPLICIILTFVVQSNSEHDYSTHDLMWGHAHTNYSQISSDCFLLAMVRFRKEYGIPNLLHLYNSSSFISGVFVIEDFFTLIYYLKMGSMTYNKFYETWKSPIYIAKHCLKRMISSQNWFYFQLTHWPEMKACYEFDCRNASCTLHWNFVSLLIFIWSCISIFW